MSVRQLFSFLSELRKASSNFLILSKYFIFDNATRIQGYMLRVIYLKNFFMHTLSFRESGTSYYHSASRLKSLTLGMLPTDSGSSDCFLNLIRVYVPLVIMFALFHLSGR